MDNLTLARRMDEVVLKWLVEHGALPPFAEKAKTPEAEQKIQAATAKLNHKLQTVFDKSLDRLATEMDKRGWPGSPELRRQLIQECLGSVRKPFSASIVDAAVDAAKVGRVLTVDELRQAGMSIVFGRLSSVIERQLRETTFQASNDTLNRIIGDVDDVMATLANQVAEGAGIDEASRALRDVFTSIQDNRLQTIAQTEITSAQNAGAHQTMVDYGVNFKQWLISGRPNVRDSHRELHGCVIRVGETYPNGLRYPGDRTGPISEWINCHCRERPYIPRRGEIIMTTPYYP